MATITHTPSRSFPPAAILAGMTLPAVADTDLAQAARRFLALALRAMPPQMRADFDTYQRLIAHEIRFAAAADADGRYAAADMARSCAARYRAAAVAMVARGALAAVL